MKRFLKFYKCKDGHYIVFDKDDIGLSCLETHGVVLKKRAVLTSTAEDVEYTSECLRQIADKLDEMEKK